ncbi:MAG: TAXI family TRAP transporter solute-binding subunit [Oscillospiraceae bacterium]|nr:TAXI family TRAP transporter solute-binding subunit [Oscillospiraceae bacterium]
MKKIVALLLALCMVLALAACGGSSKSLTFTTGGEAGTYFAFGGVMAQKISEVTNTKVTAITSGGSKANIQALEAGDADFGFSQSDVLSYAYAGSRLFDNAVTDISTVAALYMEQVQIVTLNPDIKSVADLKGKAVSIGDSGSGVYFNAIDVLGAYGLTESDIKPTYQSFADSTEALQDGQIDAAFVVAGAPTSAVTALAATSQVYLVSLDDEHIDALVASSPYYTKYVIPAETYGMPEDATTVAVGAVVIARDKVSESDVYNFLAGVFNNLGSLSHDKAKELSLEFASSVTDVPYHPGAVKFFSEQGITVPGK